MKITKSKRNNIIFLVVIILFIIPQTRKPIQVFIQKGLALINPSTVSVSKQLKLTDYNWKLKDENGAIYNLKSAKGKVVLVNVWATWCPPCIAEMPSLQKLYNDYGDKIEFVFVTGDLYKDINPFLIKNNYTFKVYKPANGYLEVFNISSIPRTFLIDKKGNIVIDKTGAANWSSDSVRETIENLLDY